jgi:hypothetical protein
LQEQELIHFAKQKLLNGLQTLKDFDPLGVLACLSVRFALEFNTDPISRDISCKQVEHHMRLCVSVTMGFERLVTFAGSEPLLAEVVCHLLRDSSMKSASHLANHSNLHCIDHGSRSELVAVLIIMQARDTASMSSGTRWVLVSKFMEVLLPAKFYNDTLVQSLPREWHAGECLSFDVTF